MAPERLRHVGAAETSDRNAETHSVKIGREMGRPGRESTRGEARTSEPDNAPHRADIYALGMVLMEALTGRMPEQFALPPEPPIEDRTSWLKTVASIYALARARSARTAIREAEAARGWRIAPGLRSYPGMLP